MCLYLWYLCVYVHSYVLGNWKISNFLSGFLTNTSRRKRPSNIQKLILAQAPWVNRNVYTCTFVPFVSVGGEKYLARQSVYLIFDSWLSKHYIVSRYLNAFCRIRIVPLHVYVGLNLYRMRHAYAMPFGKNLKRRMYTSKI